MDSRIFKYITESALVGYWDWDLRTGTEYLSPTFKQLLGFEAHELCEPRAWATRVLPDDMPAVMEDYKRHVESRGEFAFERTVRYRCKDGEILHIICRGKVIEWDEAGQPLRMVGSHVDVTAERNREAELQQSRNLMAEHNQRLLNFSYAVSHNLRSHSVNLALLLDLFRNSPENTPADAVAYLGQITEKFNDTLHHLSEVAAIQTTINQQLVPIPLEEYLAGALASLRGEIGAAQVCITSDFTLCPLVQYVPAYMESILLNLLSNAVKYRHPGRPLEVRLHSQIEDNRPVLTVTDNGLGIDLEKYGAKLFGMYRTFHSHPQARGLGLFLTKSQVESLGGSIEVLSRVGEGTTFRVHLCCGT